MTLALTFPGQGSQIVGMGRDLAEAFPASRAVFDAVDEALGERLSELIWAGPADGLTLTKNAQPALMAVSLATMAALHAEFGKIDPSFMAGHSLGEYSALASAAVFSTPDTARLLRVRGLAMQEAVPPGEGAMLALLGAEIEAAGRLCDAAGGMEVCQVANDNAPGQIVISGSSAAIARAAKLASDFGIRRTVPLPVSAPFHCAMMQPAADLMRDALEAAAVSNSAIPVVSNVTALPVTNANDIKMLLVKQVTGVVRWRESVAFMANAGVTTVFEIGAGKVLTGLARRIDARLDAQSVGSVDGVRAFGEWLEAQQRSQ